MEEPYDDVFTPDLTVTTQEEEKFFVDKTTNRKAYFDKYGRLEFVDEDEQGSGMNRRGNGEILKKFNKSIRKLRKMRPDLTFREAQKQVSQMLRESEWKSLVLISLKKYFNDFKHTKFILNFLLIKYSII